MTYGSKARSMWPFGSSSSSSGPDKNDGGKKQPTTWRDSLGLSMTDPLAAARQWAPMVVFSLLGLGALQIYVTYLRRIPGAEYLRPSDYHKKSLWGRVINVGDGDNFHMFHMPGGRRAGWGLFRKIPKKKKEIKTVKVRIAGVDAPEGAHFGRPAQPFAAEALKWLSEYILSRNVRAYVYRVDQYERAVSSVYIWRYCIRRDVGLEMIKRGLATVYEGTYGAEYGGRKDLYMKAEAKAKKKRLGMWSGKASAFESPRQYKTKWAASGPK